MNGRWSLQHQKGYFLINIGKVGSFIDDMMVETESEEGHDELVEEKLRRMEENDLYMEPEKFK